MLEPKVTASVEPFPHVLVENMYDERELELIWQELKFFTHSWKLQDPAVFGAVEVAGEDESKRLLTNSKALVLDGVFSERHYSNILTVNRKLFINPYLTVLAEQDSHLDALTLCNWDNTKIRYYSNGEYYEPHRDSWYPALSISFFHTEPRNFEGGELFFPDHDYELPCDHNSMILFPGYVKHGVHRIKTEEEPFAGTSRYSMTQFVGSYPTVVKK